MRGRLEPTFFTDRDLGKTFPKLLNENGIKTEKYFEHFPDNTTDIEWLKEIGKKGWYCISHDKRIRYNPTEREAVINSGIGLFLLVGHTNNKELAENFVNTFKKIEKFIKKHQRPFIAKVYRPQKPDRASAKKKAGEVTLWLGPDS